MITSALLGRAAADAVGKLSGLVARGPAAQVAVDLHAGPGEAGVAGAGLRCVLLARLAAGVDVRQDVVDHAAIARPIFDAGDVNIFRQIGRHHEAAVDVGARRRDREVGADVEHEVGPPFQRPVVREFARGREVGRVSLRSARLGPGGEGRDVLAGRATGHA